MLEAIIRRLRINKRGVSTVIVVMLSLVLVVIVVANVVLWSFQMNQYDWERMQEKIALTNATHVARSPWFTSQSEYTVNIGNRVNGTYTYTQAADGNYETFREESVPVNYNPSGYALGGSTQHVSGSVIDLIADNGAYMIFRSYSSAFSPQTIYAHRETTTIGGSSYCQLRLNSSDSTGLTFQADTSTTGRKLLAQYVYPLKDTTAIPTSTWTLYYRAYENQQNIVAHCDVDLSIRKADGTIRTTIATEAAESAGLGTSYATYLATYAWSNYTVVDTTDYLEIDYYAHVTTSRNGRRVYLRVDDSSLAITDQTRITGVTLPSEFTADIELTGSSSLTSWQNSAWMINSAFTASNINITLQLFNYNTSKYPTSGNGYINYVSSITPDTDETRNQTITENPTYFRSYGGQWKIRIVGTKPATSFDLKVDWVEFKIRANENFALDIDDVFTLDVSTYPIAYVHTIEMQIRYRTNDSLENWFLKAYNWTKGEYSNLGFNSTLGDASSIEFKYYTANLTDAWQSYVQNGVIRIKFCDNDADTHQSLIDIDFLGVRLVINGVRFSFENSSSLTTHVVSIWVINTTLHRRYDANFFLNSGAKGNYFRADISLPSGNFTLKATTERGNTALLKSD